MQKKRIGGPGIDRGGATLVNEKRRRGFVDNDDTEEELVDAED
jgi:predicted DNA-binding WGR domain protein